MSDTLLELDFSDIYLLKNPEECCYKTSSDSMDLLSFNKGLHKELDLFYRFLCDLNKKSVQSSKKVFWPSTIQGGEKAPDSLCMRLRATHIVDANNQSIFYIRRYRQGVGSLAQLGVPKSISEKILDKTLNRGLFLITGKAGSGKTTLSYSAIDALLKQWGGVCVTAENPVELDISGRHGPGMCFTHEALTDDEMADYIIEFMRTSPNYIFLGEIRDAKVAKVAVQAALSGHLVIATFHGQSIENAITRFAGFLGDNYTLADALSAVAFLELSESKDQSRAFHSLKPQASHDDLVSASDSGSPIQNSKKLKVDLLWFLDSGEKALRSLIASGKFPMLSSELSRQHSQMLSGRVQS